MKRLGIGILCSGVLCAAVSQLASASSALDNSTAISGVRYDVLPDMVPWWRQIELDTVRMTTANASDRLVSCDDWTAIDPTPITGQKVISFILKSANNGLGHMRIRRGAQMPDGWHFYQTTSQIDDAGVCYSVETEIAVVPTGQSGRWLPLASFSLYTVDKATGDLGTLVSCQMKRWCCLSSGTICSGVSGAAPCSLPAQMDNINAGGADGYPFHWLDQFLPIEGVPSGQYWFVHQINPAGVIIESDYSNNYYYALIDIDQEVGTVQFAVPPETTICPM